MSNLEGLFQNLCDFGSEKTIEASATTEQLKLCLQKVVLKLNKLEELKETITELNIEVSNRKLSIEDEIEAKIEKSLTNIKTLTNLENSEKEMIEKAKMRIEDLSSKINTQKDQVAENRNKFSNYEEYLTLQKIFYEKLTRSYFQKSQFSPNIIDLTIFSDSHSKLMQIDLNCIDKEREKFFSFV